VDGAFGFVLLEWLEAGGILVGVSHELETSEVLDALERTTSRKTARIELQIGLAFGYLAESGSSPQLADRFTRRVVNELGDRFSRLLLWGALRLASRWARWRFVGVIDFEAHRCMCLTFRTSRLLFAPPCLGVLGGLDRERFERGDELA